MRKPSTAAVGDSLDSLRFLPLSRFTTSSHHSILMHYPLLNTVMFRLSLAFCLGLVWGVPTPGLLAFQVADKPTETVKINGVFESAKAVELKVGSEQIKTLVIEKIAPQGKMIEKGQNVVWFKTEAIDKQIKEAEVELKLAQLLLQDAEFKHEQFLVTQKLDREVAERTRHRAQKDYDHYVKVDREYQLKSANYTLKYAEDALENVQEELNQLEKMYRQDELTEESEEIVLKRARRDVENAMFRLEGSRNQHKRTIEETLPRNDVEQEERLKRAEMAYEAAIKDLEIARQRRDLELRKQQAKLAEQKSNYDKLVAERKNMVIQAPIAGVVLHGALNRGAQAERTSNLDPGKSVTAEQVIATISPLRPMRVRMSVAESEVRHIQVGADVKVTANMFPNDSFPGKVQSLSAVPFSGNKFDCVVTISPGKIAEKLVLTTGCRVEIPNLDPASEPAVASEKTPAAADKSAVPATQETEKAETKVEPVKSSEAKASEAKTQRDDSISGAWDGLITSFGQTVGNFNQTLNRKVFQCVLFGPESPL